MQLPIDIGAVLDEATNVDAARHTSISVSIYIDDSAAGDVQAHVRQAFASASATTRVSIMYLDGRPITPYEGDDMACIVAGESPLCSDVAQKFRQAGVPVMVVSTSPKLAERVASEAKHPYPKGDVIAPPNVSVAATSSSKQGSSSAVQAQTTSLATVQAEPIELNEAAASALSERMGRWVIEACKDKRLAFALAFPFVRKPLALETVKATSMQNAGIGLVVVIPGADLPVMTLNQAKMILQIAAAYGEELTMARAKELAAVVAGGFACRSVARQVCSVVPVAGWAVKAGIGYSGTYAMGRAAIEYYEGGPNVSKLTDVIAQARNRAVAAAAKRAAKGAKKAGSSVLSGAKAKVSSAAMGAKEAASVAAANMRNNV